MSPSRPGPPTLATERVLGKRSRAAARAGWGTPPGSGRPKRAVWLDLAGLGLFAAAAGWTALAAASVGGDPRPVVALLLGAAAALAMGRLIAAVSRSLVPLAVVGAAAALLVANPREATSAFPLSAPLGYANANAAFFVQASVAALMVATIWRRVPARALAVGGAIAFALIPFAIGSVAAAF